MRQLVENADVLTADGNKVGGLDRVVLEPRSLEVTAITVEVGRNEGVVRADRSELAHGLKAACIGACYDCALECTGCAEACLAAGERWKRCLWLSQNCADISLAVGRLLARGTVQRPERLRSILQACFVACRMAREECERQAEVMPTARRTAEACARCVLACSQLQSVLANSL